MKEKNQAIVTDFLKRNGVTDRKKAAEIMSGFDLDKPIYLSRLEKGERLFQFLRNEESGRPSPSTGNSFCLAGANMDGLAIFGGGAGRRLQEFTVNTAVYALEGTAAQLKRNWGWAGGGGGGATQLYLPPNALYSLVGVGTHLQS